MEDEEKKPRETANMKEVLAIVKDLKTGIDFGKRVYANRAVISRRLNMFTLICSGIYTILYATYILIISLMGKLSLSAGIVIYCLIGVYAVLGISLIVFTVLSMRTTAKSIKKFSLALKIFRLALLGISIVISIVAIVLTVSAEASVSHVAVDIIIVIFSVLMLIIQLLPMIFGGLKELVRWLLSPVSAKIRFAAVAMEWYELAQTGKKFSSGKKVDKKHYDSIAAAIDKYLNPAIGDKYIAQIKTSQISELIAGCPEDLKTVTEGVLKGVFAYAYECGYVLTDPCAALNLSGTIEKKTMKDRFSAFRSIFGRRIYTDGSGGGGDIDSASAVTDDE